jgi:hypothetical protein
MKPSKPPTPLHSRHHHASMYRARGRRAWLLAHEFEDDEEVIVGPGNDRADTEAGG